MKVFWDIVPKVAKFASVGVSCNSAPDGDLIQAVNCSAPAIILKPTRVVIAPVNVSPTAAPSSAIPQNVFGAPAKALAATAPLRDVLHSKYTLSPLVAGVA